MTALRPFQQQAKLEVDVAWMLGFQNILMVMPTGAGKTVTFSNIIAEEQRPSVAIVHRQELVSQISLALARNAVRHRIIGPASVVRTCTQIHMAEVGRNFVDPMSNRAVAGVDTLVRMDQTDPWFRSVVLTVTDECHHVLRKNKWGQAMAMFPNARGLGVTATPTRADGCGLGRTSDGLFDYMVLGPTMRDLINDGWLTEYRIFAPPSDLDLKDVPLSASGDFSPQKLAAAVHKSHIVGDVVAHYKKIANGKLGVTFAVDVKAAEEIATAYRAAGVNAQVVSAKTPDALRASVLRRFAVGEIQQLVNVDLFGEGFDLPALEVVSFARPTESYSLYCQQFGRALRLKEGKTRAIIIDHVGNVHRHGLPDAPRVWSLDRRERRARGVVEGVIPVRTCDTCMSAYERIYKTCPYCGNEPQPQDRSVPAAVDGDLNELTPEALAMLRGEIDAPVKLPYGAAPEVVGAIKKRHREKHEAQIKLREAMALWGGEKTMKGDSIPIAQRRFFHTYGIDVGTAQTLGRKEAEELLERIKR